jgi:protein SCO1/2
VKGRVLALGGLAAAAIAALAVAVVAIGGGGGGSDLRADPVDPPMAAPVTRGRDSTGRPVSVPEAGRPALVTFLYAHCPDVCPLTAQEISIALDRAGPAAARAIDVVAVSVDPEGDTRAAHSLTGRMRYIVGTRAELRPLWSRWLIAAQQQGAERSVHSARVVLVDRDGRQVGSYATGLPFDPADLAADIRALTG